MTKKTIRLATKSLPSRGEWDKKRWEEFQRNKEDLLQAIFAEADRLGMSNDELAKRAGLAHSTVYNLVDYTTLNPQYATVWKLARAVGAKLTIQLQRHSKRRSA